MPNVRLSSGHDRHHPLADLLVAQQRVEDADERHRGRDLAPFGALELGLEGRERRDLQRFRLPPARRQAAAQGRPALAQVGHLRAVLGQLEERHLLDLVVGDRQAEAVAELLEHRLAHLLLLVGDVLALAGLAHAVALDGLGQDHGRLALVRHRRGVGGVDLAGIVAAARQAPDLLVGHAGDAGLELGVLAEEVLADIGAVLGLEVLVLAVDALLHAAQQAAVGVGRDQRVPRAAPQHLDDVPAGAAEVAFQFLDDLAVAAHRAVEALEVAVDHEDEVVELLAAAERDGAQALRLVHLAVAHEGPDLAVGGVGQPAMVQILQEAGLIDGHQRPQPHRDGGELPEVRHQPRMRIGRQAGAIDFLAEVEQLFLGQAAFQEGPGVDAGGGVALDVDQIAAVLVGGGVPEVLEAGVVQGGGRLEAGDVAAEFGQFLVGAQHDRQRVPADQRADLVLDRAVAGMPGLAVGCDRVEVGRGAGIGHRRALAAGFGEQLVQEEVSPIRAFELQHGSKRFPPFLGFQRIIVADLVH